MNDKLKNNAQVVKIKIKVPTLSRRAIIDDKQALVKQINSALDKIKKIINIKKYRY